MEKISLSENIIDIHSFNAEVQNDKCRLMINLTNPDSENDMDLLVSILYPIDSKYHSIGELSISIPKETNNQHLAYEFIIPESSFLFTLSNASDHTFPQFIIKLSSISDTISSIAFDNITFISNLTKSNQTTFGNDFQTLTEKIIISEYIEAVDIETYTFDTLFYGFDHSIQIPENTRTIQGEYFVPVFVCADSINILQSMQIFDTDESVFSLQGEFKIQDIYGNPIIQSKKISYPHMEYEIQLNKMLGVYNSRIQTIFKQGNSLSTLNTTITFRERMQLTQPPVMYNGILASIISALIMFSIATFVIRNYKNAYLFAYAIQKKKQYKESR
jgi:hypothetical protein